METRLRCFSAEDWKKLKKEKEFKKKKQEFEITRIRAVLDVDREEMMKAEKIREDLIKLERELSLA